MAISFPVNVFIYAQEIWDGREISNPELKIELRDWTEYFMQLRAAAPCMFISSWTYETFLFAA